METLLARSHSYIDLAKEILRSFKENFYVEYQLFF